AVNRFCVGRDELDRRIKPVARQRGKREEQTLAIGAKTLGLDDRPGPVRRADVEVADLLVALRDAGQHRRIVAERRLDIPAREVAVDRGLAVGITQRIDQQEHADRQALMIEHVAEARTALRHAAPRLSSQSLQPVIARAAVKSARQQVSDAIDIGFADFPAPDLWPERVHWRGPLRSPQRQPSPWLSAVTSVVMPSNSRTLAGQVARSVPWMWNIATARRSMPKATQPVCAGSPLASWISQVVPKCA